MISVSFEDWEIGPEACEIGERGAPPPLPYVTVREVWGGNPLIVGGL
jgi:hypothetical protein